MKKKILIFIIIIEVIALITLCILIYNRLSWKLRGEIIDDHIYKYSIRANEESYAPINIIDDTIYYLLEDQRVFSLYKRNIYSKEEVKVGTIEGENDYCTFDGDFIFCLNTNYDYYNTDLELVYSKSYNNNDSSNVIYYQGKFLLLIDNKIYDNNNIIRQIDFGDTTAYFFGKQVIGDNTFLIFYSPYEKMYIYYDIANDRYEKHFETLESRYNNGVFSVKDSKIIAYDFVNNEFKEYDDLIIKNSVRIYILDNNTFYFIENGKLYILNLNDKTIDKIEHEFDGENGSIIVRGKYIYVLSYNLDFSIDVYLVEIDKISKDTYSYDEYKKKMDVLIDEKVKELEEKFHVDIVYKDEVNIENDTFKTTVMDNDFVLIEALDTIEIVLNKFNTEFFDEFHDETHNGLIIYLSGEIIPVYGANTVSNPNGYSLRENDQFEIVADIRATSLKNTMCHELMHNIEYRMKASIYDEWFNYNPIYFEYMHSYTDTADNRLTQSEENPNNVYFVDAYSKSYPTEDVARIFENVCARESDTFITEYPHLYKKALYLKELLEEEFPSLKEATVFNSLNSD